MTRRAERDLIGRDQSAVGVHAANAIAAEIEAGDLTVLDEIDTQLVGFTGEAPGDVVMLCDAAPALQRAADDGVAHVGRDVDDRAQGLDLLGREPFGIDPYNSYAQRGSPSVIEYQLAAACELFPIFSRAHVLRTWAGIVDVSPDASPILGLTPIENLFINCGWGTGGFKATPGAGWVYAHTIAKGEPHPLNAPFALERFTTGALIDEHGAAAVAH